MNPYGVRDVERLLRLPRSTIRAMVDAGFVSPERGPRNTWRFSFQDLVVLRTAQALADANVPQRRITRSVRELRRHLPEAMPLSGLNIAAVGDQVVVKEGGSRWQADSGQYLLALESDATRVTLEVAPLPDDPFERAAVLEEADPASAIEAYEAAIADDPSRMDARINLGRVLHASGNLARAERVYREALRFRGSDPVLLFNLGVLLEDLNRRSEAANAYEAALRGDDDLADAHYNLALLCRQLGRPKDAIRHMAQYRRLLATQTG